MFLMILVGLSSVPREFVDGGNRLIRIKFADGAQTFFFVYCISISELPSVSNKRSKVQEYKRKNFSMASYGTFWSSHF
jgi:hypothetical protein